MIIIKALISYLCLFCLLWEFFITPVMAEQLPSPYITSTEEFYNYYGDKFTDDQKSIIDSLITKFQSYLQPDIDVETKLASHGYIPISPEFKELGALWCKPSVFLGTPSSANDPRCVSLDEKGKVVNVVWLQNKYDSAKIQTMVNNDLLTEESYAVYKYKSLLPKPTILAAFEQTDSVWHSQENMNITNLGTLNSSKVQWKQALFDKNWVSLLKQGLIDENAILATYEPKQYTAKYPGYNQAMIDGIYISQMWIGLGNPQGLLSKVHPEVSPQTVGIFETFEKKYY